MHIATSVWRLAAITTLCVAIVRGVPDEGLASQGAGAGSVIEHESLRCSTCHASNSKSGWDREDGFGASAQCLGCHGADTASSNRFHQRGDRDCVRCHSFHDPAKISAGAAEFSFDFEDPVAETHCSSCHGAGKSLTALSPGHIAAAESVYHRDSEKLRSLSVSEACLTCHSSHSGGGAQASRETFQLVSMTNSPPRFNIAASHPYGVRVLPGSGNITNHIRREIDSRLELFEGKMECQTCHSVTAGNDGMLVALGSSPYDMCLGCHQHNP